MTPERKVAEMLKLRVAYGLARLQGSSGMSLSDKELKAQLDSVLAMGKPERAIALLNKQLQTLVSSSETTKSTRVDGFFGEAGTKETFENAVWAKPMDEFIKEQLVKIDFRATKKHEAKLITQTPPAESSRRAT